MRLSNFSKRSNAAHVSYGLLLSVALPVLLVLAFLTWQIIQLDSIGMSHGFSHPLTGWDHLLTMLAVGVWAAQLRGHAIWLLPLAFVGVMSLGGLAGAAGIAIPSVEGIILLSCAVFSVLITRKIRFSGKINVMIVAFFAFFHGFAHGQEISTSASLISYTLGFMLATLLLHGAGILVAKLVVLAVSCLLAAMFSSAALAKQATISIQDSKALSTSLNAGRENAGLSGYAPIYKDTARSITGQDALEFQRLSLQAATKPNLAVFDRLTSRLCHGKDWSTLGYAAGACKKIATNPSMDWVALVWLPENYCHAGDSGFRQQFPDINHTPGMHLLSNGVGLTSPPAKTNTVFALSAVPNFRKSIHQGVEDKHLHMTFANFEIGLIPNAVLNRVNPIDRVHAIAVAQSVRFEQIQQCIPAFCASAGSDARRNSPFFSKTANTRPAYSIRPFTNN